MKLFQKKSHEALQFAQLGYVVIKDLYPVNHHTSRQPDLYNALLSKDGGKEDSQSPGTMSYSFVSDIDKVHIRMLPQIEKITGLLLYPTYGYMRKYHAGSILTPHRDRPACEISCTLCIGYAGDYSWPIAIIDKTGAVHKVTLGPGDGLIYRGCELEHWREPADERVVNHIQAFFHYVDQNGPFEDYIFDNKNPVA